MSRYGIALIVMMALFQVSCTQLQSAPVINKAPHRKIPAETVVKPGESIYMIAWEHGLDFLDIAEWNGIRKPYRLTAGQRLSLRKGSGPLPPAAKVQPPQEEQNSVVPPVPIPAPTPPAPKPAPADDLPATPPIDWAWPARGEIVARFSRDKGINGIRIAGAQGTPVRATAGGEVVYVGEGLRGYGKLVILKHSDTYLSAYAHNHRILVKEGERIGSGQQIAEMGSTGAERTMLHFEIRVNGNPQDPMKFLKS